MIFEQRAAVSNTDEADAGFLEQLIDPLLIVFIEGTRGFVLEGKLGIPHEQSCVSHACCSLIASKLTQSITLSRSSSTRTSTLTRLTHLPQHK